MKKKFTQSKWLVTMILLVTAMAMPKMAWAEIKPEQPSGNGTSANPYKIGTPAELYWFAAFVNGKLTDGTKNAYANAVLVNDITVNDNLLNSLDENGNPKESETVESWTPIGYFIDQDDCVDYQGTFDGNGYSISGLYFKNSTNFVGLFGCIGSGGKITNVSVVDSYFKGFNFVGGVCGFSDNGNISNCYSAGAVIGSSYVGGVCGFSEYGTISNCYSAGAVSGSGSFVGGVCGYSEDGTISNCYSAGAVSASYYYVGGVCGYNADSTISNCYSAGSVSASSHVGGVCGYSSGTISNCYFDNEKCAKEAVGTKYGGTVTSTEGKTTAQFMSGEVCYLLNGSSPYGEWGQQIGTNDYPIISSAYKVLRAAQEGQEGTNYWATFSNLKSDATLSVPSDRTLKVYNATVSGGTLTLTKRSNNKVALGEGVLLKANCEYVNAKANATDGLAAVDYANNNLVATSATEETITAESGYKLYRLTYNNSTEKTGLGFYLGLVKDANGTIIKQDGSQLKVTPGKAYLKVSTGAATNHATAALARGFVFPGDDEATGIGEIVIEGEAGISGSANADGRIYNLQGQQVTAPVKGLYIKNNKKVIIK